MKYSKKRARYEESNVWFDKETMTAKSYDHWVFVTKISGLVVFNEHRYSVSTSRHQRKVKELLQALGIVIDLHVDSPKSLTDIDAAIAYQTTLIERIEATLVKGRASKRNERLEAINEYKRRADVLRILTEVDESWL